MFLFMNIADHVLVHGMHYSSPLEHTAEVCRSSCRYGTRFSTVRYRTTAHNATVRHVQITVRVACIDKDSQSSNAISTATCIYCSEKGSITQAGPGAAVVLWYVYSTVTRGMPRITCARLYSLYTTHNITETNTGREIRFTAHITWHTNTVYYHLACWLLCTIY